MLPIASRTLLDMPLQAYLAGGLDMFWVLNLNFYKLGLSCAKLTASFALLGFFFTYLAGILPDLYFPGCGVVRIQLYS